MGKQINNQKVKTFFRALKPWLIALSFLLILRYSGALAGISFVTQSVLLKTGIMNFSPSGTDADAAASFDYDFRIKDLKGNLVDFKQFKGKVIFLNLWATWCGPCRVEMPSIDKLYQSVDHDQIVFVMLSLDTEENHHKVGKYIEDKQFGLPAYVISSSLPRQLRVPTIPTTFIIGKDGKVKSKKVGAANYDTEEFKKFLNDLIK